MPKQASEHSRKSSALRRVNSISGPSIQRDFSFEFSHEEKLNNPVFHSVIKPALQGKNMRRRESALEPAKEMNHAWDKEGKEGMVNGLSRWASVSSLNSESSFFLEGNLHPEIRREFSIDDPIEEGDEDIQSILEYGSVSGRSDTTERVFEEYDGRTELSSASRYGTPASIYSESAVGLINPSTEQSTTTNSDFEDEREKTPTPTLSINESPFGYHSGTPNLVSYHIVSAPITPRRYITRSGQIPPEKTKFRSPQKPRPGRV